MHATLKPPPRARAPPAHAPQKLYAVKGLSEAKAEKMMEAARKVTSVGGWQTGTDCMLRVSRQPRMGRLSFVHACMNGCWLACMHACMRQLHARRTQVHGPLSRMGVFLACCRLTHACQ